MKKTLLMGLSALALSVGSVHTVYAESVPVADVSEQRSELKHRGHHKGGHKDHAKRMERMAKRLDLTDAQQGELKAFHAAQKAERNAFKERQRAKRKAKMQEVLTPDQQTKFKKMKARHKAKHGERGEGRRHHRHDG